MSITKNIIDVSLSMNWGKTKVGLLHSWWPNVWPQYFSKVMHNAAWRALCSHTIIELRAEAFKIVVLWDYRWINDFKRWYMGGIYIFCMSVAEYCVTLLWGRPYLPKIQHKPGRVSIVFVLYWHCKKLFLVEFLGSGARTYLLQTKMFPTTS